LTEAECYARCYGGVRSDMVSVRPPAPEPRDSPNLRQSDHLGELLQELRRDRQEEAA